MVTALITVQPLSDDPFEIRLAQMRQRIRNQRLEPLPTFQRVTLPIFLEASSDNAADRLAEALRRRSLREARKVTVPQAVINENRLLGLLTQVKLRKVEIAQPEPKPLSFADVLKVVPDITKVPVPEIIEVPDIVEVPEVIVPPEVIEAPEIIAAPEAQKARVRHRRRKKKRVAFKITELIEAPVDIAVEPIDTVQRPTRAQVRQRRRATRDQRVVEETDMNVLPTSEQLFTSDTQHDIQDEPTLEAMAENPMLWKEWLADKGLEVSEVLAAWSATGAVTSGMVAMAGAAATPFIGSLFVPIIAGALLAPVARKVTGTGVSALTGYLRQQIGVRRSAGVNPPSRASPTAEERAQVRSASRKLGAFMWRNMTSTAAAVGLAGSAGQVASAALGIVNHVTSPEVVAEAAKLGITLATDGVWGIPWWAMKATYNLGTSRIGVTIASRYVMQKMGWDKVGGHVGAYVQEWMEKNDVGEGKVFSSLMSEGLKNQIREKFGEQAYQDFVETSWANVTGFLVREYADAAVQAGAEQMTVEGARAAAHAYQDVKNSGALEAATQTLQEAQDLARTATAQALEAGAEVSEAMRAGTAKLWEAVTGSEAVGESTAFVLMESQIEQQTEEQRRTQTLEEFRAGQVQREAARTARLEAHKKRHTEAVAQFHQRRVAESESKREQVEQSLPEKLDQEIVADTVRLQELTAQLRLGLLTEQEHAVATDQLMTPQRKEAILENLTEKGLQFGGALAEGFRGLKIKPQAATIGKIIGGAMGAARQTWVNRIVGMDKTEILIKDAKTWERVAATGRMQSIFTQVSETVLVQGDASTAFQAGKAIGSAVGQIGMATAGTAAQQVGTVLTFSKQAFDALSSADKAQVTEAIGDILDTGIVAASSVAGETLTSVAKAAVNNIDVVTTHYTTGRNMLKYAANVMGAMGDHDQASWMGWIGDGMAHLVNDYTPDLVSIQNQYLGLGEVDLGQVVGEFMRDRYILRTGKTTAELASGAANKILFGTGISEADKSSARQALETMLTTTFTTADAAGQYIYGTRDPSTGAPLIE